MTIQMAHRYPYMHDGSISRDAKIRKLGTKEAAQGLTTKQLHPLRKPAGTTITSNYKLDSDGRMSGYKARCSARGAFTCPYKLYKQDMVTLFSDDETVMRRVLSTSTPGTPPLGHLDLKSAFRSQWYNWDKRGIFNQIPFCRKLFIKQASSPVLTWFIQLKTSCAHLLYGIFKIHTVPKTMREDRFIGKVDDALLGDENTLRTHRWHRPDWK